jgi:hypothetical protein
MPICIDVKGDGGWRRGRRQDSRTGVRRYCPRIHLLAVGDLVAGRNLRERCSGVQYLPDRWRQIF